MTFIQLAAIISPFISATLTAFLAYKFSVRGKGFDILYQNKVPAFKEIASHIIAFKNFCEGKIACSQGNEFHPFYIDTFGALEFRTKIAQSLEANVIFVSKDSRAIVTDFLNQMSGLCNAEIAFAGGNYDIDATAEYERMATLADSAIEVLYLELNLPKS